MLSREDQQRLDDNTRSSNRVEMLLGQILAILKRVHGLDIHDTYPYEHTPSDRYVAISAAERTLEQNLALVDPRLEIRGRDDIPGREVFDSDYPNGAHYYLGRDNRCQTIEFCLDIKRVIDERNAEIRQAAYEAERQK